MPCDVNSRHPNPIDYLMEVERLKLRQDDITIRLTKIAHDGHHGMENMERYLRARLWWPGMDKMVERRSAQCEACQASTPQHRRDPLKTINSTNQTMAQCGRRSLGAHPPTHGTGHGRPPVKVP